MDMMSDHSGGAALQFNAKPVAGAARRDNRTVDPIRTLPALLVTAGALAALSACGEEPPVRAGGGSEETAAAPGAGAEDLGGLQIAHPAHPAHPGFVDLGPIPLGETREQVVELVNAEGRDLVVQNVQAGCACTVPTLSYVGPDGERVQGNMHGGGEVITLPPGTTAELLLRVDSRKSPVRNKPKLVTVRIVSDSDRSPFTTLEVRVLVECDFRAAPEAVEVGRVAANGGGAGAARIFSVGDKARELVDVLEVPDGLIATLAPSQYLGDPAWDLEVRVLPPVPLGYDTRTITLSTTGPEGEGEGEPYEIEVRFTGVPDVEVRPTRLLLRPQAPGEPARAEALLFAHLPGQLLRLESAELAGDATDLLSVELVPERPDETGASSRWTIRLEAREELGPEAVHGTVTLRVDDSQIGAIEIPYLTLARQP
jgi:hypothetical protein